MKAALGPGAIFGGYRVESLVARGGMGVVYRATDLSLQRPVALKLIAPEFAEDERFRARFLMEPRLAASLDHPHVVPIYEAGEREGRLYLAMRWVEGTDLRRLLDSDGALEPERAIATLMQVADALDATHRRGLVHRDVKPANILLDDDGHAYLTDFGITKPLEGDTADGGRVVGTTDYLAPEQIRGEELDGRTDCYALACVLYECLAGAPPFRRPTEAESLWAHLREPPPPLREHPALDGVMRQALAKDPGERPATCTSLLRAAATALGVSSSALGQRRISPAAALLLAGSLLLAAVAALAAIMSGGGDPETGGGPALDVATNSVAALNAKGGGVTLAAPLPGRPTDVAALRGTAWVSTVDSTSVTGVSARTQAISRTVPLAGRADAVAAAAGSVWVADARRGVVSRIQPGYERVTHRVRFRPSPNARRPLGRLRGQRASLAVGAGAVWLADHRRGLLRIDARTRRLEHVRVDRPLEAVAAGAGAVWAIGSSSDTVVRIDPDRPAVPETIQLPKPAGGGSHFPIAIAATKRAVWVLNGGSATVMRIDPASRTVMATIPLAADRVPTDVAASEAAAWVTNGDGSLSRIGIGARMAESIRVGESLERVAADGGRVWVTTTAFDQKLPGGAG
jgi:DNA-binding beta-propeller fold protein YncE